MSEIQTTEPAGPLAPAAAAPPPITSLRGYWAIVLPLIALGAQLAIGLVLGFVGAAFGWGQAGLSLVLILVIAGLSAIAELLILKILLSRRGWSWRDLGFAASPGTPIVAAIGIGLLTCVLITVFDREVTGGPAFTRTSGIHLVAAVLLIGILVPIAEEALFRGIVFPVLRARLGGLFPAMLLSALIFGVFHFYPLQVLVGFALGIPLAWLRHWSGALPAPIALHMTHNIGVVVLAALNIL